jgi:hypothetical protein
MTYEVPYLNYKIHVDNYVAALGGTIPYLPTSDPNVIGLGGFDDVLVSISDGVDKLIFRDQEHFMEWVLKWS